SWKHKQVSLKCYPGFSKSGEHGNPLVIDSSSDDEEVACKLIPGQSGDSSNSSSSSSDKDIPLAQLIHISSDEESPGPCTKEQTKVKPGTLPTLPAPAEMRTSLRPNTFTFLQIKNLQAPAQRNNPNSSMPFPKNPVKPNKKHPHPQSNRK
ncbi:hypothetical protein PCASD_02393, partial [Puccinia coronata f. sp. avenae]